MYELEMNDGTVVNTTVSGVGQQGDLWLHVVGLSLVECVSVFSDPAKTSVMHVNYDETISDTFEGYTELVNVQVCDDYVKVCLSRRSA